MVTRHRLVVYKLFFAFLGFSAVVTEVAVLSEQGRFNPANFFSYFTIQGNIIAAISLLAGALATFSGKFHPKIQVLRGAATTYILIVGVGFSLLLSGIENTQFTVVPWDNIVLHYIMPVALLLDWVLDQPKQKLNFKKSLGWLWFPVVYLGYSLVRGLIVEWYPYPFLEPTEGYLPVLIISAGLLLMGVGLIWSLVNWHKVQKLIDS